MYPIWHINCYSPLVAKADDEKRLDMRYQHLTVDGELETGRRNSVPEKLDDGRLRLHESWRWTSGSGDSGQSVIEEVR